MCFRAKLNKSNWKVQSMWDRLMQLPQGCSRNRTKYVGREYLNSKVLVYMDRLEQNISEFSKYKKL